jgi:uncharacterized protein (DUF433 family)
MSDNGKQKNSGIPELFLKSTILWIRFYVIIWLKAFEKKEVDTMKFTRITVNSNQMGGVPCIRGLRIPVATVVGMVADNMTEAEILKAYPDLMREDIREALQYAAEAVRERELPLVNVA